MKKTVAVKKVAKPSLGATLKAAGAKGPKEKAQEPFLWQGPEIVANRDMIGTMENRGISQSLLGKFLSCRARFFIYACKGLQTAQHFNARLEYGNMWHVCEEALANNSEHEKPLTEFCKTLVRKYRDDQKEVVKFYELCKRQFPVYVEYWNKHPDVKGRTPIYQEVKFAVPYKLPFSGRIVLLRGKWDAVDLIKLQKNSLIYLQENKTKSQIEPLELEKQLKFDLQTMLYLVALQEHIKQAGPICGGSGSNPPIGGVRYNVIRRPLAGGKGSIIQKKATANHAAETDVEYWERAANYFREEPDTYFCRFKSEVSQLDIDTFKRTFLDPCLEQLCDWYDSVSGKTPAPMHQHGRAWLEYQTYRLPYGIYNPLVENGFTEYDHYLDTGSEVGLEKIDNLFPELA